MMLPDTIHQILAEDLPPLQEAGGRELGDRATSLCRESPGLSRGPAHPAPRGPVPSTSHPHSIRVVKSGSEIHALGHSTLTLVQQRLNGELVIGPLDTILEGGNVALLAEAIRSRIHGSDLAHVALLKAPEESARVSGSRQGQPPIPQGPTHLRIMSWTPCLTLAKVTVSERL